MKGKKEDRKKEKNKVLYLDLKKIREEAEDILRSANSNTRRYHIQHGKTSVYRHCIDVAVRSIKLNRKFNLKASERELIRGALLHDYFLYDWHIRKRENNEYLHGFTHPKKALMNAQKEYNLTSIEKDIIIKHMWPITIKIPKFRESWIVVAVDKYSAIAEMASRMRRRVS
jgi:uncharacterized protein